MNKLLVLILSLVAGIACSGQNVSLLPISQLPTQATPPRAGWIPFTNPADNITRKMDVKTLPKLDSVYVRHDTLFATKAGKTFFSKLPASGSSTTTINNFSGSGAATFDTVIIYNADASKLKLAFYTPGKKVTNVTTQDINGSGFLNNYKTVGDTTYVNYSIAPDSTITFIFSGIITDTTHSTAGGNTGGGGNNGGGGNTSSGNSLWTYTTDTSCQINYGALFGLGSSSANMIALANTGLGFARVPYNGSGAPSYPTYTAGGYKVLVGYNPGSPVIGNYTPLPTDSLAYRNGLKNFFTTNGTTNVAGVAMTNEWGNIKRGAGYWNPISAKNLINLFRAGGNALHELGLKSFEGGFSGEIFYYEVWKDLINRGITDSAAAFAAAVFPVGTNLNNWATDTAHGYRINFMDSIIAVLPTLPFDGVNLHLGLTILDTDSTDATINILPFLQMVRYLHRVSGKPVISNELSFPNNSNADILSQLIDAVQDLHDAKNGDMSMVFVLNTSTHAFANPDGSLTSFGQALQLKISEQHIDVLQ